MPSSLGVFIDNNIIKYAKLQKEKDNVKVEAYNVAFFEDDLENAIKQIISETYSYKIPVSINLSNEIYSSFDISNLLSKQDTKKAINIEYEMLCSEKGYNAALLENKWVLAEKKEDPEKMKVINIIANKNEMSKRMALFDTNKVNSITPVSFSLNKLLGNNNSENAVIVNIESKTQVTTIVDGKVASVDLIDEGMNKILEEINRIENSYSKSYEVCKNMTIYTQGTADLYTNSDPYMSIVTTTLLNIIDQVKDILNQIIINVDKIYITGLATCINNIDLYFQDFLPNSRCEILKPYFTKDASAQMPIKEYIEVNSAIALALDGIDGSEVNFSKGGKIKGKSVWKKDVTMVGVKSASSDVLYKIKGDFTAPFKSLDKLLARAIMVCVLVVISYMIFTTNISKQLAKKTEEMDVALKNQKAEVAKLDSDITIISGRTTAYNTLIEEITHPTTTVSDTESGKTRVISKDSIPNLLNRIMFVIPKKVKVTSIENTTDTHIVIKAEAEKYEQLGYFKAVLSTSNILVNVKSTPGQKTGNTVDVTIEGDLP